MTTEIQLLTVTKAYTEYSQPVSGSDLNEIYQTTFKILTIRRKCSNSTLDWMDSSLIGLSLFRKDPKCILNT